MWYQIGHYYSKQVFRGRMYPQYEVIIFILLFASASLNLLIQTPSEGYFTVNSVPSKAHNILKLDP